jgi:hypothetical protein
MDNLTRTKTESLLVIENEEFILYEALTWR